MNDVFDVRQKIIEPKYPQDKEANEFRYLSPAWLDAVATGLTAGAEKHPGETWRSIPAEEHAWRAVRHLILWLKGDREDKHLDNASMRVMMAWETAEVSSKKKGKEWVKECLNYNKMAMEMEKNNENT